MFFLTAHFVIPVSSLTPMEEVSGVFFLTAHFVIPVISLLWRKVLECSSSHCSLRHPCDLTPITCATTLSELTISLTSSSLATHSYDLSSHTHSPKSSHRHPCVLSCVIIHDLCYHAYSHSVFSLTSLVLPLIPYSVFSHAPTLIALTKSSHRHP